MSGPVVAHDSKDAKRNPTSSNEYEQVFEIYTYEGHEKEFQLLLDIMKDITVRTTFIVPSSNAEAAVENQKELRAPVNRRSEEWMPIFGSTISKISHELTSKTKTDDEEGKTSKILKTLSNYSWKAKVVMVLAAFAVKYGKICLTAHLYPLNPVARAVASLRRQHSVLNHPEYLTEWHKALAGIIKKMLDLANGILKPPRDGAENTDRMAVLLIIQCAIVCSSQMMAVLISDEHLEGVKKSSNPYRWNLCALERRLHSMLEEKGVDQTQPKYVVDHRESTKPRGEKATTAKQEKNQVQPPGRSSRVKPSMCC